MNLRLFYCVLATILGAAIIPETQSCPNVTLVWHPTFSQVNETSYHPPGENAHGLEDGIVVRRDDGGFTMLSAEPYASPYAVAMKLGVYHSENALDWTRQRTLRVSTGKFGSGSLHAAHWGPIFTKNTANDTWMLSYVGYKADPNNGSEFLTNYEGTIFSQHAKQAGDDGLDSDFGESEAQKKHIPSYTDDVVLLAPDDFNLAGPWPHQCQGLQGTDSFAPYQLADGSWAALVGTSHQEVPNPWKGKVGRWVVSVAVAPTLEGPWMRYNPINRSDPANAPCCDIAAGLENPIVSFRPDNPQTYHAVYDGSGNPGFGYACSENGLDWTPGIPVTTPFNSVRTPFGLVPMSVDEVKSHEADILSFGVLNATQLHAPNTSLQWLFFSGHMTNETSNWETFSTAIIQLSW